MPSTVMMETMREFDFHGPTMAVTAMCASGVAALLTARSWINTGVADDVHRGGHRRVTVVGRDVLLLWEPRAPARQRPGLGRVSPLPGGEASGSTRARRRSGWW